MDRMKGINLDLETYKEIREQEYKNVLKEAIQKRVTASNIAEILLMFGDWCRWNAFCTLCDNKRLGKIAFNKGLKLAWTTGCGDVTAFKLFDRADKRYLMNRQELLYYQNLPKRVTIYRGCHRGEYDDPESMFGLSWTTEQKVAEFFAFRGRTHLVEDGRVYSIDVNKEEIKAVFLDRYEKEVIFCSYWSDDEDFRLVTDKPTILYDEFIKEKEERNKVFFLDKYLGC